MPLPAIIGAAVLRSLPTITRGIVKTIQAKGRSQAIREHGKKAVESAEKAVRQAQPIRTAVEKTKETVKTQGRKLVGKGNRVKRTKTGEAQTKRKTGQFIKKDTAERYDRMGSRVASRRAKKTAVGTAVVGGGSAAVSKKKKPINYNVGVTKGGVPFDTAFAHFRKKGAKTFTWNGTKYHTKLDSEMPKSKKKK